LFFQQQGTLPPSQQIPRQAAFPIFTHDRIPARPRSPNPDPRLPRIETEQVRTTEATHQVSTPGNRPPTPFAFKETAPERNISLPPIETLDPEETNPGNSAAPGFRAWRNQWVARQSSDESGKKGITARPATPDVPASDYEKLTNSISPQDTQVATYSPESASTEARQEASQPSDDAIPAQKVSIASNDNPGDRNIPLPTHGPAAVQPKDSGATNGRQGEPDVRPDPSPFFEKGGVLPSIHYQNWKTAEAMIIVILEQKGSWKEEGIRDIFDNLGIQSWWKVLQDYDDHDLAIDWEAWRNKLVNKLIKRGEPAAAMLARLIFADLERLEAKRRTANGKLRKYVQSVRLADQSPRKSEPGEVPYYQPTPKKTDARPKFPIKREQWKATKARIRDHLVQGADWDDPWIEGSFQQAGLKEWWERIAKAKATQGECDWNRLKREIGDEWHERYPRTPARTFGWLIEELKEVEKAAIATRALKNKTTNSAPDVDMQDDTPDQGNAVPEPPPLFYPATSPPTDPSIPAEINPQEFHLIKSKVKELEERVATTMEELKDRLRAAEGYAHEAMTSLGELTGQATQTREENNKEETSRGEKKTTWPKKMPTHHHFTRYAEAKLAEGLQMTIQEYRNLEERVRRSEERVEATTREMDAIEEELAKFEALQSRVVTLSRNFENFRLAQVKINFAMITNYARLRTELAGVIEPALVVQGRTILDLQTRFNALTALAANFFGEQQMISVLAPAKVTTPTSNFDSSTSNPIETTPEPFTV
jgi:tetrahydromethanopterin S-methyltransferase subunit G